jgi:hypothetical protein
MLDASPLAIRRALHAAAAASMSSNTALIPCIDRR